MQRRHHEHAITPILPEDPRDAHPDSAVGRALARIKQAEDTVAHADAPHKKLTDERDQYQAVIRDWKPGDDPVPLAGAKAGLEHIERFSSKAAYAVREADESVKIARADRDSIWQQYRDLRAEGYIDHSKAVGLKEASEAEWIRAINLLVGEQPA